MIAQIISDVSPMSGTSDTLAKNMIATLELHYPAFAGLWRVTINDAGGMVEVINLALSGRWGFLLRINNIDYEMRKVVRAGGELLERYSVSRSKLVAVESVIALPRNYRGELVAIHD